MNHITRLESYLSIRRRIIDRSAITAFCHARQLGYSFVDAVAEASMVAAFIEEMCR